MAAKKIKAKHHYDEEADVLYVHFGESEPTYVENLDDFLLVEIGWFSGLPKGFRIIGLRHHNVSTLKLTVVVKRIEQQVRELMQNRRRLMKEQEPLYVEFCKGLPRILAAAR